MNKLVAASLALAAGLPLAAGAQSMGPANPDTPPPRIVAAGEVSREAPVNGVLTLYGNQRCPTDSNGAEVVVCHREGAAEQFRIPKGLREFKVTPENEAWAAKLAPTMEAGGAGIGSCTAVGPGGGIGCFGRQARTARADTRERKKDATADLDAAY